VQTPDYNVHSLDVLLNTPIINGQTAASAPKQLIDGQSLPRPPQLLSNLVETRRALSAANINHYNVQPVYDVFANVQGRDLAAVAADVRKAIAAVSPDLPRGSSIALRGQVETMNSSFTGLAARAGSTRSSS
jgi:multidrug efflux pump subunit AcrB